MKTYAVAIILNLITLHALAPWAAAQDEGGMSAPADGLPGDPPATTSSGGAGNMIFSLNLEGSWTFDTDLGGGGKFWVGRVGGDINLWTELNHDWEMRLSLDYLYSHYRFDDGATGLGISDPWQNIQHLAGAAIFTYKGFDNWRLFIGPQGGLSQEFGADFSESLAGGGLFGASYEFSNDLILGAGFGLGYKIGGGTRSFPIIIVDWQITHDLRISSTDAARAFNMQGLELLWEFADDWELSFGGGYSLNRFRLDDNKGIGQNEMTLLWLRLVKNFADNRGEFSIFTGFTFDGELKLESNTLPVGEQDYDDTPFLGVLFTWNF